MKTTYDKAFEYRQESDGTEYLVYRRGRPITVENSSGKRGKIRIPASLGYLVPHILHDHRITLCIEACGYVRMHENTINAGTVDFGPDKGMLVLF